MHMKRISSLISILVIAVGPLWGQEDAMLHLEEVQLSDVKLKKFSEGYKKQEFKDSVIKKNDISLTSLLRYNSTIYFRENGFSGVSSASFRGTSASQTAVVWNGININSQLNGQTDFNTINTSNYDLIAVRSGGGSVQYGSGAIGGSIHLNNSLAFSKLFTNEVRIVHGSFNTTRANYKIRNGSEKTYVDFAVDGINSDNDYKYLGTEFNNENGAFKNINLNSSFGIYLSERNVLKIFHNTFLGDRLFAGLLSGPVLIPSNDRYQDTNVRNLLQWSRLHKNYTGTLSMAFLYEGYRFYGNKDVNTYDYGKSTNWYAKYDFLYHINKAMDIKAIVDYSHIEGEGSNLSIIEDRNILSGVVLLKHQLNQKLSYGLNIRQEITDDYQSPLLMAVDFKYKLNSRYTIKSNFSKNYRIPTFNDLFWGGAGAEGNINLRPETSLQGELGQELELKNIKFLLTGYYIQAKDLIKWIPNEVSVWSPVNVAEVTSYGLETGVSLEKKWGSHSFALQGNYAYTISEDQETDKQLIYVPKHKVASSISYARKKWSFLYQFLYNDQVFITTDNTRTLSGYDVSNVNIRYQLLHKEPISLFADVRVNNIYNKPYQGVGFRPMPNRNFQFQITFKF